ncbi:uncharacterized protein LOC106769980 isoform X2 [Vigna radiata var. radiata]|uniref:Uncharacterized protein LOC106769980 isoform X2 n=1 Tax=Vigna radiata var. radiata TaxID=3916 RepID=A0A1S3UZF4_VIGRR|nr:uncharacterized protein LOC106769980 isoform X2 [Vigna radiata var. radiata]
MTTLDGILELEPMNSYNRLLLHRLAEIFGFAHGSVGEGDDRHLILERCPDTSIPPILVSDILWKYDDEPQSLVTSHQILRRSEASSVSQTNKASFSKSLEERKAAYLVARERIFSMKLEEVKEPGEQKPRSVPVVARRMIAHALGQRIHTKNQNGLVSDSINDGSLKDELNVQDKNCEVSNLTKDSEEILCLRRNPNRIRNSSSSNASSHNKRNDQTPVHEELPLFSQDTTQGQTVNKDYMKKEHLGAAKRMFAHALGVQSGKDGSVPRNRSGEIKKN